MRPYQLLFAGSSNEALAKLPPRVEQRARFKLRALAASQPDEAAPEGERPLRLFEIPPYAFAYVVDRELRSVVLERIYVVLRTASWAQLFVPDDARPLRH